MSKILIIDDDELVLDMMQASLEEEGYEVVVASCGVEGVNRYREELADVVITDLIMPDKEGTEILMEIKREFPKAKVIVMSGGGRNTATGYLATARALGADLAFQKPIQHEKLIEGIEQLLELEPS
jgi:CheY-like chemotaxis protein